LLREENWRKTLENKARKRTNKLNKTKLKANVYKQCTLPYTYVYMNCS
jgi:hypothetical protein